MSYFKAQSWQLPEEILENR